jgi:hypothetical protein
VAALMASGGMVVVAVTPADASSVRSVSPQMVTRSVPVTMTCADDVGDPPGTGPFDNLFNDLVVTAEAPATEPFGGTIAIPAVQFSVSYSGSWSPPPVVQMALRSPSHTRGQWFGTLLIGPTGPGRYSSEVGSLPSAEVYGQVGEVMEMQVPPLTAMFTDILPPPYGSINTTVTCTPAADTPPLTRTLITAPPGGAPAHDQLIVGVRDLATGLMLYHVAVYVTTGDFTVANTPGSQLLGGAVTYPGLLGGTASATLYTFPVQTVTPGGGISVVTDQEMSLVDPSAGIAFHGAAQRLVYGGPPGPDSKSAIGAHLIPSGEPVVVEWEVRDLTAAP